jgi:methyl-accepting chemotaxis protein
MPERVLALSRQVSAIATSRVKEIRRITRMTKILGINAAIEAARSNNAAFGIVASEIGSVSTDIDQLAETLQDELSADAAGSRSSASDDRG